MDALEQAKGFFQKASGKSSFEDTYKSIVYILVELGWTQKDIYETEIPFIFMYLDKRAEVIREQEREAKKKRK